MILNKTIRIVSDSGGRGIDLIALNLECSVNPDLLGRGTTSLKGESTLGPVGRILAIGKYTMPEGQRFNSCKHNI